MNLPSVKAPCWHDQHSLDCVHSWFHIVRVDKTVTNLVVRRGSDGKRGIAWPDSTRRKKAYHNLVFEVSYVDMKDRHSRKSFKYSALSATIESGSFDGLCARQTAELSRYRVV